MIDCLFISFNRNLRGTNIKHWDTSSLMNDLPNLEVLNTEKNKDYMPDENILGLPHLARVHFLDETFLARYKVRCILSKNTSEYLKNGWMLIPKSLDADILAEAYQSCTEAKLVVNRISFWNMTSKYDFKIICTSKFKTTDAGALLIVCIYSQFLLELLLSF